MKGSVVDHLQKFKQLSAAATLDGIFRILLVHRLGDTMATRILDALHDVHTATNDVLKGYREMSARAEPDIETVIRRLTEMHERHAAEQSAELLRLRDTGTDDTSVQGAMNKVVVILRDWLSDLDRDTLPAVRKGETALHHEYETALRDVPAAESPSVRALLKTQMDLIASEITRLPSST